MNTYMNALFVYRYAFMEIVLLFSSLTVIVIFLWAEYGLELQPCLLCLYQRIPWYFVAFLCVWTCLLRVMRLPRYRMDAFASPATNLALHVGVAIALLFGGVLSVYHGGVELNWFAPPTTCSPMKGNLLTLGDDSKNILRTLLTSDVVDCRRVSWRLPFDLSAAWGNAVVCFSVLVVWFSCVIGLRRVS